MGAPEINQHKQDYMRQKANAKRRGIAWLFTYSTWLEFWGEDIERRGAGHDKLCMQRFGDSGPYSPDNVKKDYPKENARTAGVIRRHANMAEHARTKQSQDDWEVIRQVFYGA